MRVTSDAGVVRRGPTDALRVTYLDGLVELARLDRTADYVTSTKTLETSSAWSPPKCWSRP